MKCLFLVPPEEDTETFYYAECIIALQKKKNKYGEYKKFNHVLRESGFEAVKIIRYSLKNITCTHAFSFKHNVTYYQNDNRTRQQK